MIEKWLKCKIYPGMFPTEYTVEGQTAAAQSFSAFISTRDLLEFKEPIEKDWKYTDGYIKVVELKKHNDTALISLPIEMALSSTIGREIIVRSNQLIKS